MQKIRKTVAFLLTTVLITLLSPMPAYADDPTVGPVHVVGSESDLTAALGSLVNGDTIKLTADINYPYQISIDGISITFDLDIFNLDVENNVGHALYVCNGGEVLLAGSGELNVIAEGGPFHGVYVFDSSRATVTNAYATGDNGCGAYASSGSSITVVSNVSANGIQSYAAQADLGGHISVGGKAVANGNNCAGAKVWDGTISIDGDVEALGDYCNGIYASDGEITVKGDVTVSGTGCQGAVCATGISQSIADVKGNITASGNGCYGTYSNTTDSYFLVGGTIKAYGEYCRGAYSMTGCNVVVSGSAITDGNDSYAVFAEGSDNTIRVGQDAIASGSGVYGVSVNTGSTATVGRNVLATGIGRSYGAYTNGGTISVGGDITAGYGDQSLCAFAENAGILTVSGSAVAEGSNSRGAYARGLDSTIVIGQNITDVGDSCFGALASDGGKVTVSRNVTVTAVTAVGGVYGSRAESGGIVTVSGIVAATGAQSWGASVEHTGSSLFIEHNVDVTGEYCHGVFVSGSAATVKGDITIDGDYSVAAEIDYTGKLTVNGNLKANGVDSGGVLAYHSSVATVSGIITSSGTNNRGARADNNSVVTVDGSINARYPIILDGLVIDSTTPSAIGNYLIYVKEPPKYATIRIKLPMTPVINTNPQDLARNENEQAVFTAAAIVSDGGTLQYQWQKSTDGGIKWRDIYGATGATFSIAHVASGDNGSKYRCGFKNDKNKGSSTTIYSSAASLTVTPAAVTPTIQTHPASITRTAGDAAGFTVSATVTDGGILTYQWQISSGAISWNNISGATGTSLTISAVVIGDSGNKYRCVVTNNKNGTTKSVNTNAATLTVNPPPAKILVSIPTPAAIIGLANGTDKTAAALGLPTVITMKTNSGDVNSSVNWNVASCSYNPSAAAAQKFDVTGTAILPAGVVNTNSVPLTVSISVSVSAKAADITGGKSTSSSKPGAKAMIKTGDGKTDMISINVLNGSAFVSLNSVVNEIEMPNIKNVNQYALEMPASVLSSEKEEKKIGMTSKIGMISIPDNMLNGMGINGAERVKISMGEGDKSGLSADLLKQIGSKPLIELKLSSGDKTVEWNNPSAPVTVSIPYPPTAAEVKDPEHIVVWYIDGRGNIVDVPSGRYDDETGMVTFSTIHFSQYAITYVTKTFNDLGTVEWARKPVEVLASKGIVEGLSDREFEPKKSITRGDYLCFLVRTLNIEASFDENFTDVSSDAYNYRELGIAKKLGIASGTGKNQFHPEREITRQDMMVLTERTLKMRNYIESEDKTTSLDQFTDSNKIAVYAKGSVDSLVKEGLITGSGNRLNPRGNTTRAEAAVFLYRIYEKYDRPAK